ncbi:cytochrome P450 89A2-like [Juglans regia]|uniref:Cytochrome P450 89A2-like n=2 Tax=Juglans regia TaxID=51240 RepID=A0A2I4DEF1_JUGRE|nr:cytochrome P450 89A2-like [Juglans regia]
MRFFPCSFSWLLVMSKIARLEKLNAFKLNLFSTTSSSLCSAAGPVLCSEFINAGADTSLTTLQWIMANIVKHPHIQAKLFAEIKAVVGEGAEEIKEEDVQKMTYLKAVILETLRIHPPSTFLVPHAVSEDAELLGYRVPKDTTVNFVISLMGRDPKEWENPMEFRPERLLNRGENGEPDRVSDVTAYKMMPFGSGRRLCPGKRLALLNLEYFVSNLVWNFEWKPVDREGVDLSVKEVFLMVVKNPLRAHVHVSKNQMKA